MHKKIEKKELLQILTSETSLDDELIAISAIKVSRLYGDSEIREAMCILARNSPAFERLCAESGVILEMETALRAAIEKVGASFISPQEEFLYAALALEICQRRLLGLSVMEECNIDVKADFADKENYKSKFDEFASTGYFLSYFTSVLKSLFRTGEIVDVEFSTAKLHAALGHVPLASQWEIFHERRSFWENGCSDVIHNDGSIEFDSAENETVSAFRLSLARLRAFRFARRADSLDERLVSKGTSVLPLGAFRSESELMSCYLTHLQFYSKDLSESIFGAQLCEWVRGYTILVEMATEYIYRLDRIECEKDMFLRGDLEFFVAKMVEGGLPDRVARVIIRRLTFSATSKDILDTPLLDVGGSLLMIPTVVAQIEPAFSLESLLRSVKDSSTHELAIIGPGLEKNIKNDLRAANIRHAKVVVKQFDCDVAFVINSALFLVECKGKYQVSDFRSYLDLEAQLVVKSTVQHARTCDFFSTNLQHIRRALKLPAEWRPSSINRIIVTSAKIGRVLLKDGFIIIDENIFHMYFSRTHPRSIDMSSGQRKLIFDSRLDGAVTEESFLSYISTPPVMTLFDDFKEVREISTNSGSMEIVFRDVEYYGEVQIVPST